MTMISDLFPTIPDVISALVLLAIFVVVLHELREEERARARRRLLDELDRHHDPRPRHFRIW